MERSVHVMLVTEQRDSPVFCLQRVLDQRGVYPFKSLFNPVKPEVKFTVFGPQFSVGFAQHLVHLRADGPVLFSN